MTLNKLANTYPHWRTLRPCSVNGLRMWFGVLMMRMRACYLHCVLKYLSHEAMTNTTLRERFGIPEKNKAQVSGVISAALDRGLIKLYDPKADPRAKRYIPYWVD